MFRWVALHGCADCSSKTPSEVLSLIKMSLQCLKVLCIGLMVSSHTNLVALQGTGLSGQASPECRNSLLSADTRPLEFSCSIYRHSERAWAKSAPSSVEAGCQKQSSNHSLLLQSPRVRKL